MIRMQSRPVREEHGSLATLDGRVESEELPAAAGLKIDGLADQQAGQDLVGPAFLARGVRCLGKRGAGTDRGKRGGGEAAKLGEHG